MLLDENSHQTVTYSGCVGDTLYACRFFACLHTRQDQNGLHLKRIFFAKIGIFCKLIAGPLCEAKMHWIVNWLHLLIQLDFVWRHTNVCMKNSSQ